MDNLPAWIAALCAILTLVLGLLGKILIGLRNYDKRLTVLEQAFKFCSETHGSRFEQMIEDIQHEQRRRDELWTRMDQVVDMIGGIKQDVAFLRGAQERRRNGDSKRGDGQ
jgi:hypothetical protein